VGEWPLTGKGLHFRRNCPSSGPVAADAAAYGDFPSEKLVVLVKKSIKILGVHQGVSLMIRQYVGQDREIMVNVKWLMVNVGGRMCKREIEG
jgi:hypothetical protein